MRYLLAFAVFLFSTHSLLAQKQDTVVVVNDSLKTAAIQAVTRDSLSVTQKANQKFNPRKASIRSAILPGWGQAYNRKYWKIPIVYGALGTTAYVFYFNLNQYRRISFAYNSIVNNDLAAQAQVDADLQPFVRAKASNDLRNYRNSYRRDIDYSVLVFMVFWGLNVVDATVDAHLKGFDVSDELSLNLKTGFSPMSNTTGISLVLDIHKPRSINSWIK